MCDMWEWETAEEYESAHDGRPGKSDTPLTRTQLLGFPLTRLLQR